MKISLSLASIALIAAVAQAVPTHDENSVYSSGDTIASTTTSVNTSSATNTPVSKSKVSTATTDTDSSSMVTGTLTSSSHVIAAATTGLSTGITAGVIGSVTASTPTGSTDTATEETDSGNGAISLGPGMIHTNVTTSGIADNTIVTTSTAPVFTPAPANCVNVTFNGTASSTLGQLLTSDVLNVIGTAQTQISPLATVPVKSTGTSLNIATGAGVQPIVASSLNSTSNCNVLSSAWDQAMSLGDSTNKECSVVVGTSGSSGSSSGGFSFSNGVYGTSETWQNGVAVPGAVFSNGAKSTGSSSAITCSLGASDNTTSYDQVAPALKQMGGSLICSNNGKWTSGSMHTDLKGHDCAFSNHFAQHALTTASQPDMATTAADEQSTNNWSSKWYKPLYNIHGEACLSKYVDLVDRNCYSDGKASQKMDLGTHVHFMSQAVGASCLKGAKTAHNWTSTNDKQYAAACEKYKFDNQYSSDSDAFDAKSVTSNAVASSASLALIMAALIYLL